jgi:hypothetical protein
MEGTMIDTLRLARRLADNGMKPEQADAIAEEINLGMKDEVASKSDVSVAKSEIKEEMSKLETRITTKVAFMLVAQLFAIAGLSMYMHHG